jgi:isopentenyldiphosphate isomerase
MPEYLDILDEKGNKTGEARTYEDAHKFGLIHRATHVWILNNKNQILLQKRNSDRAAYPDYWDISTGGHVSSGETSLEGAKREAKEELNLDLKYEDLKYLFTMEEHIVLNNGTYVNNEFQDVYLVHYKGDLDNIVFDTKELAGYKFVEIEEFKRMIADEKSNLVPHKEEYAKLLSYLS